MSVGHGDDRTVQVGAPDRDAGQLLQRRGARVTVAIARAAADDRGVRRDGGEERAAGRGIRAVVTDLEHVALDVRPRRQNSGLDFGFRVAHEQERGILIGRPEDDRNVVQVVCLLRDDDRDRCVAEREGLSLDGHGYRDVFGLDCVEHVGIGLRVCGRARQQHIVHIQREDDVVHAADVVGVRVRADDIFQFIRADLAQIAHDIIAVRVVARIDQHVFAVARQQDAVRLSDVQIFDNKRFVVGCDNINAFGCAVPQYARVERFGDKARGHHGAATDQLGGHIERLRLPADLGGRVVNGHLHGRAGFGGCHGLRRAVPVDLGVERFKNRAQRHERAAAQDGRRHIGLQCAAVDIQVDRKRARQQHGEREQRGEQFLFHGVRSPLIGLLIV